MNWSFDDNRDAWAQAEAECYRLWLDECEQLQVFADIAQQEIEQRDNSSTIGVYENGYR